MLRSDNPTFIKPAHIPETTNVVEPVVSPNTEAGEVQFTYGGYVTSVADGIAYVHGLTTVCAGEVVQFKNNVLGLAVNLEEELVGVTILGNDRDIRQGDYVEALGTLLEVKASFLLWDRTLDALGNIIDGSYTDFMELCDLTAEITGEATLLSQPVEIKAPGIIARASVNEPILTGLIAIDSMIPIGRGQRELIIGDRQTGKTAIAVDTIIMNQLSNDVVEEE